MPTLYSVIRRPLITEKGLGVKETEGTLVFEVAPDASKTEVKQAVEALFKVKNMFSMPLAPTPGLPAPDHPSRAA